MIYPDPELGDGEDKYQAFFMVGDGKCRFKFFDFIYSELQAVDVSYEEVTSKELSILEYLLYKKYGKFEWDYGIPGYWKDNIVKTDRGSNKSNNNLIIEINVYYEEKRIDWVCCSYKSRSYDLERKKLEWKDILLENSILEL